MLRRFHGFCSLSFALAALLVCAAPAWSADLDWAVLADEDRWAAEVRALWEQVQRVPVTDETDVREQRGPWVKGSEHGAYKVVYTSSGVVFTDTPPTSPTGVRAVWKRAAANTQSYVVSSRGTTFYTHYWMRTTWIAEKGKWERGPAKHNRAQSDDINWRAWMKKVGYGAHMKGSGISSWRRSHSYLVRSLSSVQTSRDRLGKFVDGVYKVAPGEREAATARARESLERAEGYYEDRRAKTKASLIKAGGTLGVGDAMWRCQEATLDIFLAASRERRAEGTFKMWKYRARKRPTHGHKADQAKREWQEAGTEVNRLRSLRRAAMRDVMRGITGAR